MINLGASSRGDCHSSAAVSASKLVWRTLLLGLLILTACSGPGRTPVGDMQRDGAPSKARDVSRIPDAVPRVEPITAAGNKSPYTVFGRTYHVMPSAHGYREQGVASWYGTKFHGRNTSNGEVYDLYGMTAAHRSLPIPSYVRVTNLTNQRSVIVRVNDRGPFHSDRIIDLSWAAAQKLGFANHGVAQVVVEAIDPRQHQSTTVAQPALDDSPTAKPAPVPRAQSAAAPLPANTFLQVGAFSTRESAEAMQRKIAATTGQSGEVRQIRRSGANLFRVLLGPLDDQEQLASLTQQVINAGQSRPFVVYD